MPRAGVNIIYGKDILTSVPKFKVVAFDLDGTLEHSG